MRNYIIRSATCRSCDAGCLASAAAIVLVCVLVVTGSSPAWAFPWSIDMFRGASVQPLAMAPRVMPDGTLPVDGLHYNVHYSQPQGMLNTKAIPPMKLELMTVRLQNPLQPTRLNLTRGRILFETECAPCHGITGKGDGSVVHLLQHKPANLLTGVSKNLPDGYVYGYIRNGGIWMPSYDDAMSSNERWQVVLYMRELERQYGEPETKTSTAPSAAPQQATTPPAENQPTEAASGGIAEQVEHSGEATLPVAAQPGATETGTTASLASSE